MSKVQADPVNGMRMNSPVGKEILARVRRGDFAHAGEAKVLGGTVVWARRG